MSRSWAISFIFILLMNALIQIEVTVVSINIDSIHIEALGYNKNIIVSNDCKWKCFVLK